MMTPQRSIGTQGPTQFDEVQGRGGIPCPQLQQVESPVMTPGRLSSWQGFLDGDIEDTASVLVSLKRKHGSEKENPEETIEEASPKRLKVLSMSIPSMPYQPNKAETAVDASGETPVLEHSQQQNVQTAPTKQNQMAPIQEDEELTDDEEVILLPQVGAVAQHPVVAINHTSLRRSDSVSTLGMSDSAVQLRHQLDAVTEEWGGDRHLALEFLRFQREQDNSQALVMNGHNRNLIQAGSLALGHNLQLTETRFRDSELDHREDHHNAEMDQRENQHNAQVEKGKLDAEIKVAGEIVARRTCWTYNITTCVAVAVAACGFYHHLVAFHKDVVPIWRN